MIEILIVNYDNICTINCDLKYIHVSLLWFCYPLRLNRSKEGQGLLMRDIAIQNHCTGKSITDNQMALEEKKKFKYLGNLW